ncbi:hypothetical protein DRJ17_04775 [Candidatus Woesearchaeota archaeon]|nr:MAG: hypothetical protein DRJ17_04775 [Candidatus Woesearchaeota archaeon]
MKETGDVDIVKCAKCGSLDIVAKIRETRYVMLSYMKLDSGEIVRGFESVSIGDSGGLSADVEIIEYIGCNKCNSRDIVPATADDVDADSIDA